MANHARALPADGREPPKPLVDPWPRLRPVGRLRCRLVGPRRDHPADHRRRACPGGQRTQLHPRQHRPSRRTSPRRHPHQPLERLRLRLRNRCNRVHRRPLLRTTTSLAPAHRQDAVVGRTFSDRWVSLHRQQPCALDVVPRRHLRHDPRHAQSTVPRNRRRSLPRHGRPSLRRDCHRVSGRRAVRRLDQPNTPTRTRTGARNPQLGRSGSTDRKIRLRLRWAAPRLRGVRALRVGRSGAWLFSRGRGVGSSHCRGRGRARRL